MGFKEELREALMHAFRCATELEIMLSDKLDWNLHQIAGGNNYKHIVYRLIIYAESQGKLRELIEAAKTANPGNPKLQTIDLNRIENLTFQDNNLLYEALLSLNYQDQVDKFQKFWNYHNNCLPRCFLVRGEPKSCQRWLLNRLLQTSLRCSTTAKKVRISLAERGESYIEDIWAKLSLELKTSASPQKLVTQTYEDWQKETVIIVFPNFDRLCPTEAKQLIEKFWNPLVEKVQNCSQGCNSYLVMFLVDNRGYASEWKIDWAKDLEKYSPLYPMDLEPISDFSEKLLISWVMGNHQLLGSTGNDEQLQKLAQDFWRNSRQGIPELAMEEICKHCGSSWSDIMNLLSL
ncbi:hypothetical protein F7734_01020 [Scytonema sp. UIC 10036]|uniref:effector-associated domain EAD1-containing protein n=1 Tax=Scytonema sp. UIC 10036 TaxID=2304196 RepID=UPI0012DABE22|nr:effector-associated domain EAD1-containing protein [Scytonema sp. UIC 10036]MUG91154.1 hypothetical protein [Scytonema sp. UIC 10036]